MTTAYEMSNHDCEHFLQEGGTFVAAGGRLTVAYEGRFDRYLLVNNTGNGGEYLQHRFSTIQDIMEQLGGSLEAWEAVGGKA